MQLTQTARDFSALSAQFSLKFCANFAFIPRDFVQELEDVT